MKQFTLFIAFLGSLQLSFGQESIEAVVSKSNVAKYERFNYEIIYNSGSCQVVEPDFGELEVLGVPSRSQYSSTQYINGVRSQSTEFRLTYTLRAKKEGTFTISAAQLKCGNETFDSDPIKITVSEGGENTEDNDFYLRLTTNKNSVYEGEPFVAKLKYYAKIRPESIDAMDLGDAVGIYRQDLNPDRKSFNTNIETINGVRYYTIDLREELCFAQRSGTVKLEPYYASLTFTQGFFNRFRKETYSNTSEIKVKKIPGSDDPLFNGLVGDFSVSSEISHTHVKMGDAIDIKITIEGKGNMQDLGNVSLDFPQEFNQFDPNIEDKTSVSRSGIQGKIEYNFVVIPEHYGTYKIPGYSFTYFDLDKKRMKTVSTDDFEIKVDKREGVVFESPQTIPDEASDIQYIEEENNGFFVREDFVFGTWTYYTLLLSPLLVSFFFVFFKRKKENLSDEDILKIQQRKAVKVAQTGLKEARVHLETGENNAALKGLQSVLNQFFMQKFNVGLSDLSQRKIDGFLSEANIDSGLRGDFNRIWNTIEMGQYAPIAHDNLVQTMTETEKLIIELDKNL